MLKLFQMPQSTTNVKRVKLDPKHMEKTVRSVLNKEMLYRDACNVFGVKFTINAKN